MPDKRASNLYNLLARHYDQLFTFANPWRHNARRAILGGILRKAGSVCDLACGTGTSAIELASSGAKVFAVDLSPAMCEITRKKAAETGVNVNVIEADMRSFRLPERVDLITCEFDALNHVPKHSDLARVLRCAARALKPGGHLYFDVNTRRAFEEVWPLTWWAERPGFVLVTHGGFDEVGGKAWSTAEFFVQEGDLWRRSTEHIEEVCWPAEEILAALHEAGFASVRSRDAQPFFNDPFVRRGHRTFYLAQKAA